MSEPAQKRGAPVNLMRRTKPYGVWELLSGKAPNITVPQLLNSAPSLRRLFNSGSWIEETGKSPGIIAGTNVRSDISDENREENRVGSKISHKSGEERE